MVYMSRREACLSSGPLCSSSSASSPSPGNKIWGQSAGFWVLPGIRDGAKGTPAPVPAPAPAVTGLSFSARTFLVATLLYALQLLPASLGSILHLGDVPTVVKQEMAVDIFQFVHWLHIFEPEGERDSIWLLGELYCKGSSSQKARSSRRANKVIQPSLATAQTQLKYLLGVAVHDWIFRDWSQRLASSLRSAWDIQQHSASKTNKRAGCSIQSVRAGRLLSLGPDCIIWDPVTIWTHFDKLPQTEMVSGDY